MTAFSANNRGVELLPICRRGSRRRFVGVRRSVRLAALEFQLFVVRIDRNYVYVSGAIGDKVEVIAVFDARRPFREADYATLQAVLAVFARAAIITLWALLSRYAYRSCPAHRRVQQIIVGVYFCLRHPQIFTRRERRRGVAPTCGGAIRFDQRRRRGGAVILGVFEVSMRPRLPILARYADRCRPRPGLSGRCVYRSLGHPPYTDTSGRVTPSGRNGVGRSRLCGLRIAIFKYIGCPVSRLSVVRIPRPNRGRGKCAPNTFHLVAFRHPFVAICGIYSRGVIRPWCRGIIVFRNIGNIRNGARILGFRTREYVFYTFTIHTIRAVE